MGALPRPVCLALPPAVLAGMLPKISLELCVLFARAEPLGQVAIAPHPPDPQRALGRRCLCLLYLDSHGIGVLSLKLTKEEEDGNKDVVALAAAQITG